MADLLQVLSGAYAESEPKYFSEPIDEDEEANNYDYYADSDLEDDEDSVNAGKMLKKAIPLKCKPLDPANDKKSAPAYGEWDESSGKGTIIKIHDIAFLTYGSSNPDHHTTNHFTGFRPL